MRIFRWTPIVVRQLVWAAGLCGMTGVQAHHSYSEFDGTQTVEIEGTLLALAWQNPHTRMEVRVLSSSNGAAVWDIETGSVNSLRRQGAPLDAFKVGDVVKIAGWPSKRTTDRMYATNLLGGGRELMFPNRNAALARRRDLPGGVQHGVVPVGRGQQRSDALSRLGQRSDCRSGNAPRLPGQGESVAHRSGAEGGRVIRSGYAIGHARLHPEGYATAHGSAFPDRARGSRRHDPVARGGIRQRSHDPHGG